MISVIIPVIKEPETLIHDLPSDWIKAIGKKLRLNHLSPFGQCVREAGSQGVRRTTAVLANAIYSLMEKAEPVFMRKSVSMQVRR